MKTVTVIPGDGVGSEVVAAALRVIAATGAALEWDLVEAGAGSYEREGTVLPERVLESLRRTRVGLKGPLTTSTDAAYGSPNVALRSALDLHTTIRPTRSFEGLDGVEPGIDLVVVKMNHEDLYSRLGFAGGGEGADRLSDLLRDGGDAVRPGTAFSIKTMSEHEVRRVAQAAYEFAVATGRSRVTIVHKATLVPHADGLFLEVARAVGRSYPGIETDDALVDAVCERIIAKPGAFDVLLLPRMYGDIVSGVAAAKAGGIGLAPGVNIGEGCTLFEAAHGSAPRLAGRNRANPFALILSGVMMLHHLGEDEAADRIEAAVEALIRDGGPLTYDLAPAGRASTTSQVADAVIAKL